jgi:GNAT superfamily N-acetyltransferase
MTISGTIDLLQTLHASISGVDTAPLAAAYPDALNTAHLPLVLTWPETGNWSLEAAGGLRRQDRQYKVQVFVRPVAQGRGIGSVIATCADLLQAFGEAYIDPGHLALADLPPVHITLKTEPADLSDTGIAVLTYAGVEYHGFSITVGVYEQW